MNLYLEDYLDRVSVGILRNLMTLNEIIKFEYQIEIITKIYPYPKYFLIEEGFTKVLTNNMLMIQTVIDFFSLQNSRHRCCLSSKKKNI